MSTVKLKNQVAKALAAAVLDGRLAQGVLVRCRLSDRRLWVDILDAPFDVLKPENITEHGYRLALNIGGGPDTSHTEQGIVLRSQVTNIARTIASGALVHFDSQCYLTQARRMKDAKSGAAVPYVDVQHEHGPGGTITLSQAVRCFSAALVLLCGLSACDSGETACRSQTDGSAARVFACP
jgi:hypothetical protein